MLRALGPERVAAHNAALVSEAAAALRRCWEGENIKREPLGGAVAAATTMAAAAGTSTVGDRREATGGGVGPDRNSQALRVGAGGTGGSLSRGAGNDHADREDAGLAGEQGQGAGASELLVIGGGGDWEEGGVAGMLAVQLPPLRPDYGCTAEDAVQIQRWLRYERNIEVPVVAASGSLWVRISSQIYNEKEDYDKLGEAISVLRRS
ncbi:hypothetical protein Vretimale_18876 [Volvox reticuliferus]|nr:hypothetical protein Vretifemale_18913 [Volvox reticuliferus]GIM16210.1 hypothetical protein Vretimale_18876 [Volvox reticuliferus]